MTYNIHLSCKHMHLSFKSVCNKEHKGVICNMTSSSNSSQSTHPVGRVLWEKLLVLSRFHSKFQADEWNFCPLVLLIDQTPNWGTTHKHTNNINMKYILSPIIIKYMLIFFLSAAPGGMRYAFPAYPENMNGGGGGYPFPNPAAAAAAAAAGLGVHSTTSGLDHPAVSHSTPHSTPHSTLSDSGNHLPKPESSDVH